MTLGSVITLYSVLIIGMGDVGGGVLVVVVTTDK